MSSFGGDSDQLQIIREHLINELKDLGEKHFLFIISNSKEPIGVVQLQLVRDKGEGHIHALQVDKKFNRRGVGTEIMMALEKYCVNERITKLELSVDKSNDKAILLYTKLRY